MKNYTLLSLIALSAILLGGLISTTIATGIAYGQSFNAQDDKNNPTFPSTGNAKKPVNPKVLDNMNEVCAKNPHAAQCYVSP